MQGVRSKGARTTERRLRAALVRAGIQGWKVNAGGIVGCPDFYFPEQKVAIFVDGCFWHGCPKCKRRLPKTNRDFWQRKIERNRKRDLRNARLLRNQGISVIRIWEHELASKAWWRRLANKLAHRAN